METHLNFKFSKWLVAFAAGLMLIASSIASADDELTIGSDAPQLNVEHWVQDGEGKFKHVTQFEDGKVYIVEFWATWCGPCIAAMPHISELQNEFREKGVQVISVSDEKTEIVEKFLDREVRGGDGETYRKLTSNYCLTTDPDRSTHEDYMKAANQNGIPTAFIVGKDGKIEWIGHPMEIDEPVKMVVAGDWDRAKFQAEFVAKREMEKKMSSVFSLLNAGKMKEGLKELEALEEDAPADMKLQVQMTRFQVMSGEGMEGAGELFLKLAKANDDNPPLLNQLAWGIVEMVEGGNEVSKNVLQGAREAADKAVKALPGDASILDTQAHLAFLQGDVAGAIKIQKAAVEKAKDPRMKKDLAEFLEKLEEEAEVRDRKSKKDKRIDD